MAQNDMLVGDFVRNFMTNCDANNTLEENRMMVGKLNEKIGKV